MAATFVLVHGGFGTPAELAPVIPGLEARGHRAVTVDLPCEDAAATLEDYARAVVEVLGEIVGPRILVGHSAGGATIALVAGQVPVDRIVFVTAVVPEPGRSIFEAAGAEAIATIDAVTIDHGDGTRSFNLPLIAAMAPPEEQAATLAYLEATQRKQGWLAMNQPWPGKGIPDVPRSYVLCTEDTILPPARQREFAASLGVDPIEIASDHEVFGIKPDELAAILAGLAG